MPTHSFPQSRWGQGLQGQTATSLRHGQVNVSLGLCKAHTVGTLIGDLPRPRGLPHPQHSVWEEQGNGRPSLSLAAPFLFSCMEAEPSFSTSIRRLTFLRKSASRPSLFLPRHLAVDQQAIPSGPGKHHHWGHRVSKQVSNREGLGSRVMWREQATLPSVTGGGWVQD